VDDHEALTAAAQRLQARLAVHQVGVTDGSARHDPLRLASAFEQIMKQGIE
jgi:hypothetical protein